MNQLSANGYGVHEGASNGREAASKVCDYKHKSHTAQALWLTLTRAYRHKLPAVRIQQMRQLGEHPLSGLN